MSGLFLQQQNPEDLNYDGFYDGQNKTIPNDTELTCAVTGGFVGIEEGKSLRVCMVNIVITTPGEFFGQKYKFNAKMYDIDKSKRDLARRNLGVLDAQAGFPMSYRQAELTTESIDQYWVGKSEARVKFGLFITDPEGEPDGVAREINFIRGFGNLREKMVQAGGEPVQKQGNQEPTRQQHAENQEDLDDLDF